MSTLRTDTLQTTDQSVTVQVADLLGAVDLRTELAADSGASLIGESRYNSTVQSTLNKLPYYLSAGGFPTGGDDNVALQSFLDSVPVGSTVIWDIGSSDILTSNQILLRRNGVTHIRQGTGKIKLTQSTTQGHILAVYDGSTSGQIIRDVTLVNMGVDGDSWGYPKGAAFGENGIAGTRCENIRVIGGHVVNCREGASASYGTGGKGIQFEFGVNNIWVEGVLVENCSIAMETGGLQNDVAPNDFRTCTAVTYTNMVAKNCERLISMNHPFSPPSADVRVNSCVIDGVHAYNCGRGAQAGAELAFGAIIIDRYSNAVIRNVVIENDGTYGAIEAVIRFIRGENNRFENIVFRGATNCLVSHVKPVSSLGYSFSGLLRRNFFDVSCPAGTPVNFLKVVQADITGTLTNSEYNLSALTPTSSLISLDTGALPATSKACFKDLQTAKTIEGLTESIRTGGNAFPTQNGSWNGAFKFNGLLISFGTGTDSILADTQLNLGVGVTTKISVTATNTTITAGDYASDAAAGTGGVAIGSVYWNSSTGVLTKRRT